LREALTLKTFPGIKAVDRYIVSAVLPYVCMAFAVLSAILLIQQSARFAEVLGETEAPLQLAVDVLLNLLPGVLIFSIPVAVLVGTATGFGQMGHDSELTAMGAAGVGSLRLIAPAFFLGCALSALTLYVAFGVAPAASQNLRAVALKAALYKIESPVDPRTFYTGIPGKVIYIRDGDKRSGEWQRIFMEWKEPDGQERLVTARAGRLDFGGERAELVLEDAVVTTLPAGGAEAIEKGAHVTVERSANMRLRDDRLNFGRDSLTRRIQEREPEIDELGWGGLVRRSLNAQDAAHRREAEIALHKRLTLGLSPLLFAFFGACLGLKVVRGGRSQGILLSLAYMLIYYLLSLAGEQLARAGSVAPLIGAWFPFVFSVGAGSLLLLGRRRAFAVPFGGMRLRHRAPGMGVREGSRERAYTVLGLIDRAVFWSLVRNFLLTLSVLVLIFMIFTASELLRFVVGNNVPASVLSLYLLYLLPYTFIAIMPVVTLLSVLITFALMVKRNEVVAWWSSGQSVFRLILPCIFFAAILGAAVWVVQEKVVPGADRRQNALRNLIKTGAIQSDAQPGRTWVTSPDSKHIYAYDTVSIDGRMSDLALYDFDEDRTNLTGVTMAPQAYASAGSGLQAEHVVLVDLKGDGAKVARADRAQVSEGESYALKDELKLKKPSEYDFATLSNYIKALKAGGAGVQPLVVALERRRVEPFFPLVMCLTAAPLALMFGRRGTLVALCVAIGAGLLFLGAMNALQELGSRDLLSAPVAVWSPSVLFLAAGLYFLSRART
jgi:LPS export ABC transporter permease LptG